MQDLSSTVSYSPSFSFYASGEFAAAAVKVSRESQSYNNFTNHSVKEDGAVDYEDAEFEFETSPLHDETTFVQFPTFTPTPRNDKNDDVAVADGRISENVFPDRGWSTAPPSPLWSELDEFDEFENFSGNCLWSPIRSPATGGGHNNKPLALTSNTPKRCRIRDFLRRSRSDGAVSSPIASKRSRFKDFMMRRSNSDGAKGGESDTISPAVKGKDKTASHKVMNIVDGGDKRRKSYLPYRQDLIGVFAGLRRFRH